MLLEKSTAMTKRLTWLGPGLLFWSIVL